VVACGANTYSTGASDTCTDCVGGHSGAGASSCVTTPPGHFYDSGSNADVECPAGTFSETGAASEEECGACEGGGQFSPTGSSYCSVAGAGQVPTGDRTDSTPCPKNHFSTGAVNSCTPCINGHSPVGSVACISTPVGYYFHEVDSSDVPCPAGRHSTGAASIEECQLCEDGFIAASPGSGFCSVCSAGTYSNTNNTECVDCGIGKMSGTAASTCELCEDGKFTKAQGSSECTLCTDVISKSTGSSNQCYCKPGWYLAESGIECEEMMEGAADNTPRATLAELPLEEGFWRATDSSLEVKSCMVPEACVGGNSTEEYCREGHTGPYCNVCEDNYSKDVFGLCNSCAGEGDMMSVLLTILTLIAMIVAAYFFNKKVLKKYKKEVRGMKAAFRIMFVSYQILAVLPSIVPEMKLPENFTEAMEGINFLNLNPFQLMNLGCLSSGFNFHAQLVIMTIFPLILCAALFLIGSLRRSWKGMMETLILVVLYAVLPSVSTTVFAAIPCDELDTGEKFLIVDYAINCDESSYTLFAAYAGLMMLVYPIGVPALFAWLLARKKKHIVQPVADREEDNELAGIGFLFDNYKPSCWYFEIVVTVLRLLLTGVLGLIEPGSATQLCVGMLIAVGAMLQLCVYLPYENKRDNVLSVLGYVQIFLVMLCGLMLKCRRLPRGWTRRCWGCC